MHLMEGWQSLVYRARFENESVLATGTESSNLSPSPKDWTGMAINELKSEVLALAETLGEAGAALNSQAESDDLEGASALEVALGAAVKLNRFIEWYYTE